MMFGANINITERRVESWDDLMRTQLERQCIRDRLRLGLFRCIAQQGCPEQEILPWYERNAKALSTCADTPEQQVSQARGIFNIDFGVGKRYEAGVKRDAHEICWDTDPEGSGYFLIDLIEHQQRMLEEHTAMLEKYSCRIG